MCQTNESVYVAVRECENRLDVKERDGIWAFANYTCHTGIYTLPILQVPLLNTSEHIQIIENIK